MWDILTGKFCCLQVADNSGRISPIKASVGFQPGKLLSGWGSYTLGWQGYILINLPVSSLQGKLHLLLLFNIFYTSH